jgi:hypothetical protein
LSLRTSKLPFRTFRTRAPSRTSRYVIPLPPHWRNWTDRVMQVDEVGQAHPRIVETIETMVKKGKWTVPGYKEKFGDLSLM